MHIYDMHSKRTSTPSWQGAFVRCHPDPALPAPPAPAPRRGGFPPPVLCVCVCGKKSGQGMHGRVYARLFGRHTHVPCTPISQSSNAIRANKRARSNHGPHIRSRTWPSPSCPRPPERHRRRCAAATPRSIGAHHHRCCRRRRRRRRPPHRGRHPVGPLALLLARRRADPCHRGEVGAS